MRSGLAFSRSLAIQTCMFEPSRRRSGTRGCASLGPGQGAHSSRLNPLIPLSAHDDATRSPAPEIRCHSPFFFFFLSSPLRHYEPFNSNTGIPFREFVTLSLFADRIRPGRRSFRSSRGTLSARRYPRISVRVIVD